MDMDDTLPKAANKPRLAPARMFLRSNHKVRFRDEVSKDSLMFDLGEEYSAEIEACTKAESFAAAFGMLEVIGNAKDPKGPLWCLYIMEALESGFCKIGVSLKPLERLAHIQTCNPHRIVLYACVFSCYQRATEIESGVLKKAADEGWRAQGEWVRASPEQALIEVFEFAKRECYAICDPATWFENMRRSTLRRAASSPRYRDRI